MHWNSGSGINSISYSLDTKVLEMIPRSLRLTFSFIITGRDPLDTEYDLHLVKSCGRRSPWSPFDCSTSSHSWISRSESSVNLAGWGSRPLSERNFNSTMCNSVGDENRKLVEHFLIYYLRLWHAEMFGSQLLPYNHGAPRVKINNVFTLSLYIVF